MTSHIDTILKLREAQYQQALAELDKLPPRRMPCGQEFPPCVLTAADGSRTCRAAVPAPVPGSVGAEAQTSDRSPDPAQTGGQEAVGRVHQSSWDFNLGDGA